MNTQKSHWWHSINQSIASSRAGAWIFSRLLHHMDRMVFRLSGGKHSAVNLLAGLPVVNLTSTGAKSGQARTTPLLAIVDGDTVVLIASNWGGERNPAWYYNLRANPEAEMDIQGQTRTYIAEELEGEDYQKYWRIAEELYTGYAAYKRRASHRHIPVMALRPKEVKGAGSIG